MSFGELLDRVMRLTELEQAQAFEIANTLWQANPDGEWTAAEIVAAAQMHGYEPKAAGATATKTFAPEITMDPAEVLAEVYMHSPRVSTQQVPRIGKAPTELQNIAPEFIEALPEEVQALLVKIDLLEGKATFWLWDEANEIDRPVGPIDLMRYDSANALFSAFEALMKRLPRVIAADTN